MKNLIYCSLIMLVISFTACNQQNKSTENKSAEENTIQLEDPRINKLYSSYIILKDALVKSDSVQSIEASKQLAQDLSVVEGCKNTAKYADSLSMASDLKTQRDAFNIISSDIIALMKHSDIKSGNVYIQYCPMADNGNGAYWLANQKDIRNPYYGDEMLECGEVKEELTVK